MSLRSIPVRPPDQFGEWSWERTYIGWFDILHKQFKLIRVSKALPPTARVYHLTNNEQMLWTCGTDLTGEQEQGLSNTGKASLAVKDLRYFLSPHLVPLLFSWVSSFFLLILTKQFPHNNNFLCMELFKTQLLVSTKASSLMGWGETMLKATRSESWYFLDTQKRKRLWTVIGPWRAEICLNNSSILSRFKAMQILKLKEGNSLVISGLGSYVPISTYV